MIKRILSVILIFVLMFAGKVPAVQANTTGTLSVISAEGKPGETVKIGISLDVNPGIAGLQIFIGYDNNVLKVVKITNEDVLNDSFNANHIINPLRALWYSASNTSSIGIILTVEFTILDNVTKGSYPISLGYSEKNTTTQTGQRVSMNTSDGVVTVTGDKVQVSGRVESYNPTNPTTIKLIQEGVEKYKTTIKSNSALSAGQHEQNFIFENVELGKYTLEITKAAHTKFIVNNIIITKDGIDFSKHDKEYLQVMTLIYGDLNGDGKVGKADLDILWNGDNYGKKTGDTGVNPLCDLNGDGMINSDDVNILWSEENYNKGNIMKEW